MRKIFALLFALSALTMGAMSPAAARDIKMATTTSTDNSGLLKVLLPKYEAKCGCKVHVVVAKGFGVNRRDVMYNDFILIGPKSDPAQVRGMKDVLAAMKKIKQSGAPFVSRGDDSGTNKMELGYWKAAGSAV